MLEIGVVVGTELTGAGAAELVVLACEVLGFDVFVLPVQAAATAATPVIPANNNTSRRAGRISTQ